MAGEVQQRDLAAVIEEGSDTIAKLLAANPDRRGSDNDLAVKVHGAIGAALQHVLERVRIIGTAEQRRCIYVVIDSYDEGFSHRSSSK